LRVVSNLGNGGGGNILEGYRGELPAPAYYPNGVYTHYEIDKLDDGLYYVSMNQVESLNIVCITGNPYYGYLHKITHHVNGAHPGYNTRLTFEGYLQDTVAVVYETWGTWSEEDGTALGEQDAGWFGQVCSKSGNSDYAYHVLKAPIPSSPTSVGTQGQMSYDTNYFYVCYATNQWARYEKSAW